MKKLPKCILTGATGGIGQAIAKQLSEKGYPLVLVGRNIDKLKMLGNQIPGEYQLITCDIANDADRANLIAKSFHNEEASVLINNAGISNFSTFNQVSDNDINNVLTTNLLSTMQITHAFLNKRSVQKSTIINVGSTLGSIGFPGYSLYCASKFGLKGFSEALSREVANTNTRICYLAPRATDTSINSNNVIGMNKALGSKIDSPEMVAKELIYLLEGKKNRRFIGWPEKFFARLNGVFPELVDLSMKNSLPTILKFTEEKSHELS
ncbi:SDR family oxidoreductase [Cognaticolwellia mytili]|uniref:SDR family oxidoreductase n=1 Tax=Cognaticolwellia mytili TaxID=1888913 RepID=UPI000A173FDA|nr:SDR family oxidoreductase [Cognaticolwellia mytili]